MLSGQAAIAWERETENHIRGYILQAGFEPAVFDVAVSSNIVSMDATAETEVVTGEGSNRNLQDDVPEPTLVIEADISVTYRSSGTEHDVESWVFGAWSEQEDRDQYVENLQRRDAVFTDITSVSVQVEGYSPPPPNGGQSPDEETKDKPNVAVIAGASIGGAAFILLAVYLFIRISGDRSQDDGHQQSQVSPETSGTPKVAVST